MCFCILFQVSLGGLCLQPGPKFCKTAALQFYQLHITSPATLNVVRHLRTMKWEWGKATGSHESVAERGKLESVIRSIK